MLASKRVKFYYTVLSLAYILLGVFMLALPDVAHQFINYVLGGVLVLMGLLRIAFYFIRDDAEHIFRNDLAMGVALAALGIYFFTKPAALMAILPLIFGLIVLYDSCINLQNAFDLRRAGLRAWWVFLLVSVCAAMLGVLLLVGPFGNAADFFLAIVLVADGMFNLLFLLMGALNRKRLERKLAGGGAEDKTPALAHAGDAEDAPGEAPPAQDAGNTAEPEPENRPTLTAQDEA